jgi:hypothetical protein
MHNVSSGNAEDDTSSLKAEEDDTSSLKAEEDDTSSLKAEEDTSSINCRRNKNIIFLTDSLRSSE